MPRREGRGEHWMTVHICSLHCAHLSTSDVEIIRLVAEDLTNGEIAHRLGCRTSTIRNRIGYLLAAFGAHSRTGLVVAALKDGTIVLDEIQVKP